jgi:hypothetical protein
VPIVERPQRGIRLWDSTPEILVGVLVRLDQVNKEVINEVHALLVWFDANYYQAERL